MPWVPTSETQKHNIPGFLAQQKQNSWLPSVHSIFSSSRLYIFFVGTFCNILKNQLYLAGHKKISVLVVGALKVGRYKTQLNPYVKKKNHPKKNLQKIRKTIIGYPPPLDLSGSTNKNKHFLVCVDSSILGTPPPALLSSDAPGRWSLLTVQDVHLSHMIWYTCCYSLKGE